MMPLSSEERERLFQLLKRRADRVLHANVAAYKDKILATIEYEFLMIKREQENGNDAAVKRHKMMAEIYQSILYRICK